MYRLPDKRVSLNLDGPVVEVQRLASWFIEQQVLSIYSGFAAAKTPAQEYEALVATYARFVEEAQPSWSIADHRGPIPATTAGMIRLPLPLSLAILTGWLETLQQHEETVAETAVDAIIEPGPFRDALNKGLRAKRKAA